MATYTYNELDSDEDSHAQTPTFHPPPMNSGGDEEPNVQSARNFHSDLTPSLLVEDSAHSIPPPPTHPPPLLSSYDELDEEQAWGIVNPIGSENHLPTAYESDWSIPSTAWGHSAGTGTSCLAGGHSDGWGADMNSCPPMNSTPAPRPPVSEAAVLDDATRVSEITRVMSDLELPPAHETHWSLPRSQAARPTPPKNSSTDVHGSLYYNCRDRPSRLFRSNADSGETYRVNPFNSDTKTDMPNSTVMKTSLDGEPYLSIPLVFKHITLGGRLSESDLCSLGEYIVKEYRHLAIAAAIGTNAPPYSRPKIRIEKWNPRDGCMREISIRHYKWCDYHQVAKFCLDWWMANPNIVVY